MKKKWPLIAVAVTSLFIAGYVTAFKSLLGGLKDLDDTDVFDIGD